MTNHYLVQSCPMLLRQTGIIRLPLFDVADVNNISVGYFHQCLTTDEITLVQHWLRKWLGVVKSSPAPMLLHLPEANEFTRSGLSSNNCEVRRVGNACTRLRNDWWFCHWVTCKTITAKASTVFTLIAKHVGPIWGYLGTYRLHSYTNQIIHVLINNLTPFI